MGLKVMCSLGKAERGPPTPFSSLIDSTSSILGTGKKLAHINLISKRFIKVMRTYAEEKKGNYHLWRSMDQLETQEHYACFSRNHQ